MYRQRREHFQQAAALSVFNDTKRVRHHHPPSMAAPPPPPGGVLPPFPWDLPLRKGQGFTACTLGPWQQKIQRSTAFMVAQMSSKTMLKRPEGFRQQHEASSFALTALFRSHTCAVLGVSCSGSRVLMCVKEIAEGTNLGVRLHLDIRHMIQEDHEGEGDGRGANGEHQDEAYGMGLKESKVDGRVDTGTETQQCLQNANHRAPASASRVCFCSTESQGYRPESFDARLSFICLSHLTEDEQHAH